ncbi:hypothetical protein [Paenibacillus macquariensis]|nr:hypothetical protein [Paenibacillus macquariensis]MEC0090117.1 hypothetical protein [Paenibacillus macquariensis]
MVIPIKKARRELSNEKLGLNILILGLYGFPFVYFSMYKDFSNGSMIGYLLMLIVVSMVAFFATFIISVTSLIIGNIVSTVLSYYFIHNMTANVLWGSYFSPLMPSQLFILVSILMLIPQLIAIILARIIKKKRPTVFSRWVYLLIVVTSLSLLLWLVNVLFDNIRHQRIMDAAALNTSASFAVQEAIEVTRMYKEPFQPVYIEPVSNGVLVLHRRFFKEDGFDVNVEFLRWTWQGWKWTWGGWYEGGVGVEPNGLFVAYLQNLDDYLQTTTPFPILFGAVTNKDIKNLRITDGASYNKEVSLIIDPRNPNDHQRTWFAKIPRGADKELTITGFGANGERITERTLIRDEFLTDEEQSTAGTTSSILTTENQTE